MTALQTEALTADEMVKIAREQIDAFNNGDWEQMRALLASDAATTSLEPSARSRVPSRSSSCSRAGRPRSRTPSAPSRAPSPAATRRPWK